MKELQTRNVLLRNCDLTEQYPNRIKECVGCPEVYFVSLKKVIAKSKYCSRLCADKNQPRGYWNIGKTPSIKTRKKLSEAHRGEKSYLWKGGITEVNQLIRTGLEYRLWRESVFKRDNWTCVKCSARSGKGNPVILNADHIKPFAYFPKLRFELSNGRTLCKPCHKKTDTYRNGIRKKYPLLAPKYKKI